MILAYMCVKLLVHLHVCHRGSNLGPVWVHFGSISGFWVHFGSISGPFRVHFAYCLNVDASRIQSEWGPRIGIWTRISIYLHKNQQQDKNQCSDKNAL